MTALDTTLRVTVCQLDNRPDEFAEDLKALVQHTQNEQTNILLLPEMCFHPWLAASLPPDSDKWEAAVAAHDDHISRLERFGTKAVIGTRPVVHPHGSRRNQAYVWNSKEGAQPIHEKYYLPDDPGYWEHTWYDRGPKEFPVARAAGARIGVQICTEMWFMEWARHYARSRADLLCIPRVTPREDVEVWLAGGQAAAVCSGAYCLSSNLWTPEGHPANCGGLGWIVGPDGEILATTSTDRPFATAEIDLKLARAAKDTYPRYVKE